MGDRWASIRRWNPRRDVDWGGVWMRVIQGSYLTLMALAVGALVWISSEEIPYLMPGLKVPDLFVQPTPTEPPAMYMISDTFPSGVAVATNGTFEMKQGETVRIARKICGDPIEWGYARRVGADDESILQPIGSETFRAVKPGRTRIGLGCVPLEKNSTRPDFGIWFYIVVH